MDPLLGGIQGGIERLGPRPVLQLSGPFELDRHQLPAPCSGLDQSPHGRLARRVEIAGRVDAHDSLRAQRTVEQIVQDLSLRCGLRRPLPAEVPARQLIGLEHAGALADGHYALVESHLQRPLRRLAARPRVLFFQQHVVVDIPDRERALLSDEGQHPAQVLFLHRSEPGPAVLPVPLHVAEVEPQVARRHVGQRMRPVLEDRLVDRLRLAQMVAPVSGDARVEDLVMAALDHVDGVDLHIAQVLHRGARRPGPAAERRVFVEPLGAQPEAPGVRVAEHKEACLSYSSGSHRRSRKY